MNNLFISMSLELGCKDLISLDPRFTIPNVLSRM